ncbi:hypothetical protein D3C73_1647270 [compost metagenome]
MLENAPTLPPAVVFSTTPLLESVMSVGALLITETIASSKSTSAEVVLKPIFPAVNSVTGLVHSVFSAPSA